MKPRCTALGVDGRQCRKRGVGTFTAHGDSECHTNESWWRVWLCAFHARTWKQNPYQQDVPALGKKQT